MTNLQKIIETLDLELRTKEIDDYSGAYNGLQVTNPGEVSSIACAVDASLPVIRDAVANKASLLIVHHGLFWQGVQALTGPVYEKFRLAIENKLAIYSSHLPLDIHPTLGNNSLLADGIGLKNRKEFGDFKGNPMGIKGSYSLTLDDLLDQLENLLGCRPHHCPGRGNDVGTLGIITGGAGSEVARAASHGINTFLTGEGPHWSYPLAQELGINLIYAGHYATETLGVQALARLLEKKFSLPWTFIDHPTGL